MPEYSKPQFNPQEIEARLRSESETWDTSHPEPARPDDIPVLNLEKYFSGSNPADLEILARQLHDASTRVGFYYVKGHGIPAELLERAFLDNKRLHELPLEIKMAIQMDRPEWPVTGVGYLPFQNRKLPARRKGNANEAFIVKRESGPRNVSLDDNQWPPEEIIPGFRRNVEIYADAIEDLAMKLLPIYAHALGLSPDYFKEGFRSPMYRLRMSKYPSIKAYDTDEFGIAPHVDTTFFTILAQDSEGLTIFNEQRKCWIRAPVLNDALIINTGELLKQWTNDYFISVKHFANNNTGDTPRYSIPVFINATADYRMHCIPTCCSEENPPKYPPVSYLESQAVAQGE
jgi:isopenicillin N synthase-like dioxygenase